MRAARYPSTALLLLLILLPGAVESPCHPTGRTIVTLSNRDYAHPAFSPSGRFLALSEVISDTASENTQVLVYDFVRAALDTVLPASAALKYAVYKAYVSDLQWSGDTLLAATIPDGDVGFALVTFNVPKRMVVSEQSSQGGADVLEPSPLADSLARLYPSVAPLGATPSEAFSAGLGWPTIRGTGFLVLQNRYHGQDNSIWLYALDRPEAVRLLQLPTDARASLAGGFAVGHTVVFAAGADILTLYRWQPDHLDSLMSFQVRPQAARLVTRAQVSGATWFILQLHESYERGHNPAFCYDRGGLTPLNDYPELYDLALHLPTRRIAFVYWEGTQRHLAVKELGK